ncbi:VRR-NUC domain-containing protein [Candidatus Roizmanbacteria bacterium]|nr:VRR-NUC domain-containing protein [Candidatus Roizmanbacteria bacterium]
MFKGNLEKKTLRSIMMNPLTLKTQCEQINWPLLTIYALKMNAGKWNEGQNSDLSPEEVVVARLAAENKESCWCEGMGINILMRAAALDVLTKRSIFNGTQFSPREDAIRGFFEGKCMTLKAFKPEILTCIKNISPRQLQANIAEICADPIVQYSFKKNYPFQGILQNFLTSLADSVDSDFIAKIAAIFFRNPYDYRSGWPDLTVIDKNGVSFIEVKTTDRLHESQLRFAKEIAKPLGLECCVVQLHPEKH